MCSHRENHALLRIFLTEHPLHFDEFFSLTILL
jgi:hypothetical protein